MPSHHDLVEVAKSVRRQLDREGLAFKSVPRWELTVRLREASGEENTRLKAELGRQLEQALSDQGLRCVPHLAGTSTNDWIRIVRAGSVASDLLDAVLVPSPETDKEFAKALAKVKGTWDWDRQDPAPVSTGQVLGSLLSREQHLEFVQSLHDPDLATT